MGQIKEFLEYLFNAIKIWIIVQPWESGLRVRSGKTIKMMSRGIYFRIPYLDSIYIQENRLRVASMNVQTLTSLDGKTVTLNSAIGYEIEDIQKLYQSLYHPETTIINICMSEVAEFIFQNRMEDISPKSIEDKVLERLNSEEYGLVFKYFKITTFAVVRTYRLIQDQSWVDENLDMNKKS